MIRLDVKEYCHSCMDFVPDVIPARKQFADWSDVIEQSDTIIQCEHRGRCEAIRKYLERQIKSEEAVG